MLKRDDWLDLARKLDWDFSYVSEEEVFPEIRAGGPGCRTPLGRLGRAVPHHLRRVRRDAARRRRRRSHAVREAVGRRRGLQAAARAVAQRAQAARRDAAAGRVRRGDRQPARGALRPRQRLARRPRCSARSTSSATRRSRSLLMHELVRWDAQFDWTHKLLSLEQLGRDRGAPPRRRAAARRRTPIEFAIAHQLRVRDRLHQPAVRRAVGAGARASATGCSRRWCSSIQTDEARHAQIGAPVLAHGGRARPRATRSTCVDKWFWRSWLLFAVVTGFAMDYLTPLDAAARSRSRSSCRSGCSISSCARSTSYGLERPWYWDTFLERARPLPPHGLRQRVHLPRDGLVRLRGARPRRARLAARRSIPRSWAELRADLGADHRALARRRSRQRLRGPRHRHRRLLRSVPAGAVRRHAARRTAADVVERDGRKYIFCSEPCRWIFEQRAGALRRRTRTSSSACSPARRRRTCSRCCAQYFGLDYDDLGQGRLRRRLPVAATRRGGRERDPALRLPRGRHDRAARAGAAPTTRSPSSRASCRRRRARARRADGPRHAWSTRQAARSAQPRWRDAGMRAARPLRRAPEAARRELPARRPTPDEPVERRDDGRRSSTATKVLLRERRRRRPRLRGSLRAPRRPLSAGHARGGADAHLRGAPLAVRRAHRARHQPARRGAAAPAGAGRGRRDLGGRRR